jgi:hypothetical protein
MNVQEAERAAASVKWKTATCFTGEDCWCRIIVPEVPIIYHFNGRDEELEIVSAGSLNRELAEQIVREHNMVIDYITPTSSGT